MAIQIPLTSIARAGLAVATANILLWAVIPFPLNIWDKVEHYVAFYVLAVLATVSFPDARLLWIGAALSAFGASIEVLQALPVVNRDPDVHDWIADTLGVLSVLAPMTAQQIRFRLIERGPTQ